MELYDDEQTILFGIEILEDQAVSGSGVAREFLRSLNGRFLKSGNNVRISELGMRLVKKGEVADRSLHHDLKFGIEKGGSDG